jgi:hypothetical protein
MTKYSTHVDNQMQFCSSKASIGYIFEKRATSNRCITLMTSDETADTNQQILRDGIAWAKREFEEERDRILNSIPESYKSMFGQIGFVKWRGKVDYPVLILNPYCVPTDPARNQWISMYKKVRLSLYAYSSWHSIALPLTIGTYKRTNSYRNKND